MDPQDDLRDMIDEELELDLPDDWMSGALVASHTTTPPGQRMDRRVYLKELFRLQRELVKLQDWVVKGKLKVVVLFEGRDAAGKGGVDQAHHAAAEPARLPCRRAPGAQRSRAHAVVLPALHRASPRRR